MRSARPSVKASIFREQLGQNRGTFICDDVTMITEVQRNYENIFSIDIHYKNRKKMMKNVCGNNMCLRCPTQRKGSNASNDSAYHQSLLIEWKDEEKRKQILFNRIIGSHN